MRSLQKTDVPSEQRNQGIAVPTQLHRNQSVFIDHIYSLFDQHLDHSVINVNWLADKLGMPRRTLYRQVKSHVQMSPIELIRQCRLRKAIELLEAGHTMTETAYLIGFSTPSHFASVFRQCYQQTPTEYMANRVL